MKIIKTKKNPDGTTTLWNKKGYAGKISHTKSPDTQPIVENNPTLPAEPMQVSHIVKAQKIHENLTPTNLNLEQYSIIWNLGKQMSLVERWNMIMSMEKTENTKILEIIYDNVKSLIEIDELCEIAKDRKILPHTLPILVKNEDASVRASVGENTNSPSAILDQLAHDDNPAVQFEVAHNPAAPPNTLAMLAKNPSNYIHQQVAENSNTLPETLNLLSKSKDLSTLCHVAGNPHTPHETLTKLNRSRHAKVRNFVKKNPNF